MEHTNTKENIMGTMPEGKLLLKLAMPMIFSVLVSSLYNIVDSIFVGRLGQNALTAISLGAPASSLMVHLWEVQLFWHLHIAQVWCGFLFQSQKL